MNASINASHGGTRPRPPEDLHSPVLREHGAAVAEASFRKIYETWPEMRERYGDRGRRLTAEDNYWHLNFLDTAAFLGDQGAFDRYADWLLRFLGPRGMGPEHVGGAFGFLAEGLERVSVPPDQEEHRARLVAILETTRSRVLAGSAEGCADQT